MQKLLASALKKGDTIGLVSPSHHIGRKNEVLIRNSISDLQELGFEIRCSQHFMSVDKFGLAAGSPEQRAADINSMFSNDSVKAVWCSQGGDFTNETLDMLDYELIKANPKILLGLSDITVLLNAIHHKTSLVTFHGPNLEEGLSEKNFGSEYSRSEIASRLINAELGEIPGNGPRRCVRSGKAEGKLLGGNLECFLKLLGTDYLPDLNGVILLLEGLSMSIGTALTRLTQLRHAGVFDAISGLVIGDVHSFDQQEIFDAKGNRVFFEKLLLNASESYAFPILKISDFGHKMPNTVLPVGALASFDSDAEVISLEEAFLRK